MRIWIAALLMAGAGAGEARAQRVDDATFCATFRQLLGAANERPAFASLGRQGPARAATGLGFDACRIEGGHYGNRLICERIANPRYAVGPAPESRIPRCVPEALRMSEPKDSRLTRFRLGTLAFHVERDARFVTLRLFALPVERR